MSFFQNLSPLADKTVYLQMPGLNEALAPLGESLGFEIGMLKVFMCVFFYVCVRAWVGMFFQWGEKDGREG